MAVLLKRLFTFFTMVTFLLGVRRRPLLARPIAKIAEEKRERLSNFRIRTLKSVSFAHLDKVQGTFNFG